MSDDAGPQRFAPPATLYKVAAGFLAGAVVFAIATVLTYVTEPGHLHAATWLGFALGVVLVAVMAGFVAIQVRLRHERRRRSSTGLRLTLAGVAAVLGAGALSPSAHATFGGALLIAGLGICLGLGAVALHFARHPGEAA